METKTGRADQNTPIIVQELHIDSFELNLYKHSTMIDGSKKRNR